MNEPKKKILIIEDDLSSIKAYQLRLENENMDVQIASTGTEAVLLLENEPPDIVLLDIMLPGVNGLDVLGAMRTLPEWKDIPVIILSNLGQPEDIEKAKGLGANNYIVKANTHIDDVVDMIKKNI